ncbi:hypothetical protein QJS04_geneDACA014598 [Acorus gramineus]|uniref:Uncharacterized protein n=1 Tax=Acorus gramineus TaxID=55184 RepID=A0AAV9AQX4_ACOGR|nr:hypothetical protein QJS04_geneDACA014598 [Acorus gramineus]
MRGWERVRATTVRLGDRGSRSSFSSSERQPSSTTVRLGRVQPQPPGHRTIYVNDREANLHVRFKYFVEDDE